MMCVSCRNLLRRGAVMNQSRQVEQAGQPKQAGQPQKAGQPIQTRKPERQGQTGTTRLTPVPASGRSLAPLHAMVMASLLVISLCVADAVPALAASSSTPFTGLEGGTRHSYGPDGERRKDKRIPTGGSAVDAYGNPIMLDEEEQSVSRTRPRAGAYGVRPAPPPTRPLPDPPPSPGSSKWKF